MGHRAAMAVSPAPSRWTAVRTSVPGDPPEAVCVLEPFDAHGSPQWRAGLLMPQSRAAMLVGHALASSLYGVKPLDAVSYLLAVVGVAVVALVASAVPAGRAASVDPMRALRSE